MNFTNKEIKLFEKIATEADKLSLPTYIVGGFVRDKILKRPSKDVDIVCVGNAIDLVHSLQKKMFKDNPIVSIFKNFGTAQLKLTDYEIEFIAARKESYRADSRKPEVTPGNLEDDQRRRDFTINALYISLNKEDFGTLIDPFDGLRDLQFKVIKTPLDPDITFSDDPLRMMRAIRFATQLHFTIDEVTLNSIKKNVERIKIISQERITEELNKIMLSKKPSIGWNLLYKTGLLKIIFPQLFAMVGIERVNGVGHKDNFMHSLQVLDNIAVHTKNLWLRWAALLHDIGKPITKKFETNIWTFHGHEVVGAKMVAKIFNRLKLPLNEKMKYVKKLVYMHMRPIALTKEGITDSGIRRLLFDAGDDLDDLMLLCEADITSRNKEKVQKYLANYERVKKRMEEVEASDKLRNWQPPITGEIIMQTFNLPQGKVVGIIKDCIREAILDGKIPNTYEAAHTLMLEKAASLGIDPQSN